MLKLKRLMGVALAACMMLPLAASAQTQELMIDGDHGKLATVIQRPDRAAKYPMVMLLHGFTSKKEHALLTHLANDLEAMGIASVRFDFNGHGQSEGRFQDMTVLNEIEDAKKVFAYVKSLPEVTSVSMAGHSQGGVVTSMTAGELGRKNIRSIVLMAPAAVLREDSIRGTLFGVKFDPLNPPEYVEILGGNKVGRGYIKTSQDLPIYETAAKYRGPAFMIHGTGDVIVPYTYSLRYQQIYPKSKISLLPGFNHSFTQDTEKTARLAADFFAQQLKKK